MANKYERGKIYMIESVSAGLVYYGSTVNELHKRLNQHRVGLKRFQNGKGNRITSFEVVEHPDSRILLVEAFPCVNKLELTAREAWHIRNNPCVNKHIPDRTKHEYHLLHYQENKEATLNQCKKYYAENRAIIGEKAKKPKECAECGISMSTSSFPGHKKTKKHIAATRAEGLAAISQLLLE